VVVAACGEARRKLGTTLPENFQLPTGFRNPQFIQPGILAIEGPAFVSRDAYRHIASLTEKLQPFHLENIPLLIVTDDSTFASQTLNNFLWTTFTRTNPSHDIHGVDSFTEHKHWGCRGPLVIDARIKPHHAPPLETDPTVSRRVDKLFAKGGELYGKV